MAFGTELHLEKPDEGRIRSRQEAIAVECWFTSKGDTIPQMLKYQDQEGLIHTVRDIQVLYKEEKRYSGIPTLEYRCMIEESGRRREEKLLFFLEEHRWAMLPSEADAKISF